MAFEVKDIVESLGWDKAPETRSEFEEKLKKEFVPRSALKDDPDVFKLVGDQTGKRLGQLDTLIRQQAKEVGVDKIEGEKYEEIIPHIFSTIKTNIATLKEADKKTKDQRYTELETDLNKYKAQFESEKERAEKANQLYEQEKEGRKQFEKNYTIQDQLNKALEKVPFTDEFKTREIMREGFMARLNKRMKLDLNDKGEAIPLTPEGIPFKNPAGNLNKSLVEVLTDFADEDKVKANNNLNNQRQSVKQQMEQANGQSGNVPGHGYKKKS